MGGLTGKSTASSSDMLPPCVCQGSLPCSAAGAAFAAPSDGCWTSCAAPLAGATAAALAAARVRRLVPAFLSAPGTGTAWLLCGLLLLVSCPLTGGGAPWATLLGTGEVSALTAGSCACRSDASGSCDQGEHKSWKNVHEPALQAKVMRCMTEASSTALLCKAVARSLRMLENVAGASYYR